MLHPQKLSKIGLRNFFKLMWYSQGDAKTKTVFKSAIFDFLIKGIRYVFPVEIGRISTGVSTSISCEVLRDLIVSDDNYVWPCIDGNMRGESIKPLYEKVQLVALKDSKLHEVLH